MTSRSSGDLGAVQREKRFELDDAERLGVERAASEDHAVFRRRRERIDGPVLGIGGHDVHVMQQDERRLAAALEPRPDVAASRRGNGGVERNAFLLEDAREPAHRLDFVAGRVGGVDAQVFAGAADGFVLQL